MRIAFISDIHGNIVALDAVLADIERAGVDRIICLGDIVDLGPKPARTLRRIRELGIDCIIGNHDPFDGPVHGPPVLVGWVEWAKSKMTQDDLRFLRGMHRTLAVPLPGGAELLCVHGSPRSFDEQMLPWTPPEALDTMLAGVTSDVVVAGHTHIQMLRHHGSIALVNVGSVGSPFYKPFDGAPPRIKPWAEYGIVEYTDGRLAVDLRQVPFDFAAFVRTVHEGGMPDGAEWLQQWDAPRQR